MTKRKPEKGAPVEQPLAVPSWAVPVLLALVGAGGTGAVGVGVGRSTAESPAAMVTMLEVQSKQLEKLDDRLDKLQQDMTQSTRDRWTRTDMNTWLTTTFHPLQEGVNDHALLQGHEGVERRLDRLDRRLLSLESAP